ncbi:MAG: hypothetical protein AB7S26_15100 [Sandaracinaceae bacterium]
MATFRIPEAELAEHATRMHAIAIRVLALSAVTLVVGQAGAAMIYAAADGQLGVLDTILLAPLALSGPVALVGLLVGADVLRRSRRARSTSGDLTIEIDGRRLTARRPPEAAPFVDAQPILAGQAFLDHVQLTMGAAPSSLHQLELPAATLRPELLDALRGQNVRDVGRTFGTNLIVIFGVAGPAIALMLVATRLVMLVLRGAVLLGLAALPARIGLAAIIGLAALGAVILALRWARLALR